MSRMILAAGLTATIAAAPAGAQDSGAVAISGIKTQVFLEQSGRFSDDLSAAKKPFRNLASSSSELGEPAYAMLVTLVFSGPKGGQSSRTIARDMAQVTVKQMGADVTRTLLFRAYGGFNFNDKGEAYKAFLLDDATCAPLEIDVKVGRTRKSQTLDLSCDPPEVAQTDVTTTGSINPPKRSDKRR